METAHAQVSDKHPLVVQVLGLAQVDQGLLIIEEPAVNQLSTSLASYYGKPELVLAVVELLGLAAVLADQGHQGSARTVIQLVTTAATALEALGQISADALEQLGAAMSKHQITTGAMGQGRRVTAGLDPARGSSPLSRQSKEPDRCERPPPMPDLSTLTDILK